MIGDLIGEWIKGILIDGIMGNLSGLFNTVNTKVGEIASDVGSTPQDWNGGIFSMLQNLSETVIVPIAAAILALVMCYELIDMIVEKNNMHDFDSSMFFRWIFKSAFAILIVTNTWNIVMGVFDATQQVVNQSAGVIIGDTSIDFDTLLPDLESRLEAMDIGPLLGLWFQTLVVGLTMNILSICIFLVTYIKTAEMSTEQNYNMIDGMMNNAPSMEELEARAKAGEQISLLDVAEAAKAEAKKPKQTRRTTQKQKKPSIRAQLAAAKEEQKKRPPAREKSKEMEV